MALRVRVRVRVCVCVLGVEGYWNDPQTPGTQKMLFIIAVPLLFRLAKALCQTLEPLLLDLHRLPATLLVIIRPSAPSSLGHATNNLLTLLTMVTHHQHPCEGRGGAHSNLHSSMGVTWC